MEQQDWDETHTSRWPEPSRVLVQNGVEQTDESGIVPDDRRGFTGQPEGENKHI